MKVKRLLVTLGSSFAFAAALVSCGFAQEGDADYEEKIKTIDLSQYEASYWQSGKTDSYAGAYRNFRVPTADSELAAGATYVPYASSNGSKVDIDVSTIKGLNSITYDYYERTSSTEAFSTFYQSMKSYVKVEGGAPKEAGEYWVVANFHVDEARYHSIDPWVAKINVYIDSPYTSADLVWNDATGTASDGNPLVDAVLGGVTLDYSQPGTKDSEGYTAITGITGVTRYKYEFHSNSITGTTLNSYTDVAGEGTYYAILKLKAGNYYNLPTLQAGSADGEASVKIEITSSGAVVTDYTINYETEFGTAPASTTASNGTIATSNLPGMSYEGYVFEGWAWKTGARAGELVVAGDVVNTETTLVAKWTETTFHKLSNKKGVLYSNNFNTVSDIAAYDDTNMYNNAAGLYQRRNVKTADATVSPDLNKAVIDNGVCNMINSSTNYGTQLVYDFGKEYTSGVIEIAVDMIIDTMFAKAQQPIQFYGTDTITTFEGKTLSNGPITATGDIYGVRYDSGIGYRLNGDKTNGFKVMNSAFAAGSHTFYFVFDLDAHTVTTTCDGVVWDVIEGITSLSQMRIATGDGNTETFAVDNFAVAYTDAKANNASFDATTLTTGDTGADDHSEEKAVLTAEELCDGFFQIVEFDNGGETPNTVVKRSKSSGSGTDKYYLSDCTSIEIGYKAGLQFTVTDTVTFTVTVSSTGGSNVSNFYLKNADGTYVTNATTTLTAVENGYSITGTTFTSITYTLEAGTYTFTSEYTNDTTTRGGRVKTMVVALVEE